MARLAFEGKNTVGYSLPLAAETSGAVGTGGCMPCTADDDVDGNGDAEDGRGGDGDTSSS